jgi:hypothetical protein
MVSPYKVRLCDADRALPQARVRAGKTRARFCANGVEGLADATRSGRPPVYSAGEVARVKAWACELPAQHGLPLPRWSAPELARQLRADGIGASVATVRRWLVENALKP